MSRSKDIVFQEKPGVINSIAVIGAGATSLYFLKNLIEHVHSPMHLTFFDSGSAFGVGMPYSNSWVSENHMANIASEEIPDLLESLDKWLKSKSDSWLKQHRIRKELIRPSSLVTRVVLGEYLESQFVLLCEIARSKGHQIELKNSTRVDDVLFESTRYTISCWDISHKSLYKRSFDWAILALGHSWPNSSKTDDDFYFNTPWPCSKLETITDSPIGIMGSSLSAVDACLTLATKNGNFFRDHTGKLNYLIARDCDGFKVVFHSRRGLLPSLRFHFENPRLEIHQYTEDSDIRRRISDSGYLSLDYIFENALKAALAERAPRLYEKIKTMSLEQFVDFMCAERISNQPFEFMRSELSLSAISLDERTPIYWKEVVDDISYTINFYAKYLSLPDITRLKNVLIPLLKHIVAFLPLGSCEQLLALHEAGCLDSIAIGFDYEIDICKDTRSTSISYHTSSGEVASLSYPAFIDCRGQRHVPFDRFPFKSLVEQGLVAPARHYSQAGDLSESISISETPAHYEETGGVAVDDSFRPMNEKGGISERLFLLAAPYIGGFYPYNAGLPFCNEMSLAAAKHIAQSLAGGYSDE